MQSRFGKKQGRGEKRKGKAQWQTDNLQPPICCNTSAAPKDLSNWLNLASNLTKRALLTNIPHVHTEICCKYYISVEKWGGWILGATIIKTKRNQNYINATYQLV